LKSKRWETLLLVLVGAKLLLALCALVWGTLSPEDAAGDTILPHPVLFLPLCAYALGGTLLRAGGRRDRRAAYLGLFFLLLATPFSNRFLLRLVAAGSPGLGLPALVLSSVHVDAFLPYFFWLFVGEFPSSPVDFRTRRTLSAGTRVSLVAGVVLFTLEGSRLLFNVIRKWGTPGTTLDSLAPVKPSDAYYSVVLGLSVLALAFLLWRMREVGEAESRRARVFILALSGMAPLLLYILIDAGARSVLGSSADIPTWAYLTLFALFCSVPFTTGSAVVVYHVLDVRLIARKALQYALARYSAIGLAVVPIVALGVYLYLHRTMQILQIFSGPNLPLLASAATIGVAALRYRKTLLDSIDRHFFREQYDARQTLTLLVERIRATHGVLDLANLLCREADLALHPESVSLMAFEPRSGLLTDPKVRGRRLDSSSALASLVASASEPLTVDLEDSRSPLAKLPEKDRHWLVDSGFRLVAPILARDGSLLGLIGLGEKKSGLPFFKEDRQLLRAIGSSAAWVLELEQSRSLGSSHKSWQEPVDREAALPFPEPSALAAELAKECPNCGRLYAAFTVFCTHCSRRLEPSHVPYVLPGKFRFEKRIGIGGMGVVYRGTDLALGRPVAAKTLRRVSPEDAMRLRREARTAAAVSHRHLAPVYGMETWQGTPILVMELLEGGTLTQRIEGKRLEARETVELGIAMAEALEHLHASDILHRDIKPSNIGYTRDGVPKLMDFGIARVMFDLRRDTEVPSPDDPEDDSVLPPTSLWHHTPTSASMSKQLVGTLSYLSPEALNGQPADTSFDLWSLAIVLYECLLGRKIFSGGDLHQLMNRIRHGRVPEFAQVLPEHDALLGDFFRSALHRTINRRPASARELKGRLTAVRLRLVT
jgi:eukaryotic-like serine/threonine-protein kinase